MNGLIKQSPVRRQRRERLVLNRSDRIAKQKLQQAGFVFDVQKDGASANASALGNLANGRLVKTFAGKQVLSGALEALNLVQPIALAQTQSGSGLFGL